MGGITQRDALAPPRVLAQGSDGSWRRSLEGTSSGAERVGNHASTQRSTSMSRGLTYADLTAAEQGQYTTLVSRIQAASTGGDAGSNALPPHAHTSAATAVPTPAPPPAGPRHLWAARQRVFAYGKRWVARLRRQSRAPTDAAQLAHFIRIQAARRGFETFERASFPHFPAGIDPFPPRLTDERDMAAHAYPDALHRILT